jgi:hypothetical protein
MRLVDRLITDTTEDELHSALLKSLSYADQFNSLFYVVANNIAKGQGLSDDPGAIAPRDTGTGFRIGAFELSGPLKGRLSDMMNELWTLRFVTPGLGDGLNNNWPFYHVTERGKKLISEGRWPTDDPQPTPKPSGSISITPKVFRIPTAPVDPKLVSIMMPFSDDLIPVFNATHAAATKCQLICHRADTIAWENPEIIQNIFSLIYRSAIVVVDVTERNANVMYEMGIAHTLGREVIPISQSVEDLPFDFSHHVVVKYQKDADGSHYTLQEKLAKIFNQVMASK